MSTPFTGAPGSAVSDFRKSPSGVTFDAGPGNDLVLGSRFADSFRGGSGSDALFGNDGDDTLQGGEGLDAVTGGKGNDSFVFAAGDLIASRARNNGYGGLVDTVLDFRGAGTSGAGEQDVIRLEGFGVGTTLDFAGYLGPFRSLQYYEVVDPTTPGGDGLILIATAGSTRKLTAADVVVVPPPPPSNLPPAFAADSFVFALDENNAAGAAVGTAMATDPEGGQLIYAIVENADADPGNDVPFAVDAAGNVTATAPLDFEAQASWGFTLGATDAGGLADTAVVTVNVADVEERTLDFVTANLYGNSVSVLLGDGAGGVVDPGPDPAVGVGPNSVALGDLDGDGVLDLVTANVFGNTVSVRLGDGQGGFGAGADIPAGISPYWVALGDLDNDDDLDVVVTNRPNGQPGTVSVLLGDGAGGFAGGTPVSVGQDPESVALGDLNNDGNLDLATANYGGDSVSVRLGDGQGGFTAGPDLVVGDGANSVAMGYLDDDDDLDLVTANAGGSSVSVRLGDGQGGFTAVPDIAVGDTPEQVALGYIDDDEYLDLVTANLFGRSVSVRLGDGAGGFGGTTEVAVGNLHQSVALGDLDGDGNLDLVTANLVDNSVSVRLGDGQGGFGGGSEVAVGMGPASVAFGDLDGPARLTASGLPDLGPDIPVPAELDLLI